MILMLFENEYNILKRHNTHQILEVRFDYKDCPIKVFFTSNQELELLILIVELPKQTVIKNFTFYKKSDGIHINGYWGKNNKYVYPYLNENGNYNDFYDHVRQAINIVSNDLNNNYEVISHRKEDGLQLITNYQQKTGNSKENIFYKNIRRSPITEKQYNKVKEILGVDVANYLKNNDLTAVFVSDPSQQKQFIL